MMRFMIGLLEIFGVCVLRFRALPRVWAIWLVAVNLGCLYFIQHIEGQVVFAVTGAAVIVQGLIYQRMGFVRLLGIVHLSWIPMFGWMATRLPEIAAHPDLQAWLAVLFVTNAVSFIVDAADTTRFVRGERQPHYSWR